MMRKLYVFNPDTDYALSSGSPYFTPTRLVSEMERRMTLFPSLWAESESIILSSVPREQAIAQAHPGIVEIINRKNLIIADTVNVRQFLQSDLPEIYPWGWDPAIVHRLEKAGVDTSKSPEKNWDRRKAEASRENTIGLNCYISEHLDTLKIHVPVACHSLDEAIDFINRNHEACLKDPWSSSGRGVLFTTGLSESQIREWTGGVIRRRGFVMAETIAKRENDFGTLWEIRENNEVEFLGFSMFDTNHRGKYQSQIIPDSKGLDYIKRKIKVMNNKELILRIIGLQKDWLISKHYLPGFASIDMLEETDGNIRPAIEINKRMTMGIAAHMISRLVPVDIPLPYPFVRLK